MLSIYYYIYSNIKILTLNYKKEEAFSSYIARSTIYVGGEKDLILKDLLENFLNEVKNL